MVSYIKSGCSSAYNAVSNGIAEVPKAMKKLPTALHNTVVGNFNPSHGAPSGDRKAQKRMTALNMIINDMSKAQFVDDSQRQQADTLKARAERSKMTLERQLGVADKLHTVEHSGTLAGLATGAIASVVPVVAAVNPGMTCLAIAHGGRMVHAAATPGPERCDKLTEAAKRTVIAAGSYIAMQYVMSQVKPYLM